MVISDSAFMGPIFLIGMPRSGTKLLRELLNRHPLIFINNIETDFLPYLVNRWSSFGEVHDLKRFRSFYTHIIRQPYFIYRAETGRIVSADEWYAACLEYTPAGVFDALVRLDMNIPRADGLIWGDKSPSYVRHLTLIKTLYPSARFIHIIRDVRDYCLSINKAWGKDMFRAAQRWGEDVDAARSAGAGLGANYLELHYEVLLTETESELRRICTFLGVGFDPKMLTLDKPCENLGDALGAAYVMSGNLNKFSKNMNSAILTKVEALAGNTLTACGYTLTQLPQSRTKLPVFEMLIAQFRDALNLLRFERRQRGTLGAIRFYFRHFIATRS